MPIAAHKVGESTVEIGANYLAEVLGLKSHLETAQLKKFGFRFFSSEGRRDIDAVTEIGASRYLAVPSYQIDRGVVRELPCRGSARGAASASPAARSFATSSLAEGGGEHRVVYRHEGAEREASSRWLVDACGRAGLIKKKLELAEPNAHDANAVWFRMRDRIAIDDWSSDPAWRARCDPPARWLSTNHLVGEGYWAWLIPLASGAHSVGIVADAKLHPLATMNTFAKAMDWLEVHQPRLFDALDGQRDRAARLRLPAQLLVRLQAAVLGRALGPHGRGRPVPRPVLFARQRLHRHRQHLHLRAGRARPRRPADRCATRASTTRSSIRSTRARSRSTPTSTRSSATPRCCR